jgi:hypothetical protein
MGAVEYPSPPSSFMCEYVELIKGTGLVTWRCHPCPRQDYPNTAASVLCRVALPVSSGLAQRYRSADVVGSTLGRNIYREVLRGFS